MQNDSRNESLRLLGLFEFSQLRSLGLTAACAAAAALASQVPAYDGLSEAGRRALGVLVFCALMWVSEAIPAFATSLLAIGLLIALLGRPGGVFATGETDWQVFIQPWGSPLIWLFFGGFCLATGAGRTGLDRWMARRAMALFGTAPALVLLGAMLITSVLSMFVSNTATATLMVAVLGPLVAVRGGDDRLPKALLLGVAFAANIGGMGTIIGTPPNAIAAGALSAAGTPIDFARWMVIGAPPAFALLALSWGYLIAAYLGRAAFRPLGAFSLGDEPSAAAPLLRQAVVVGTFTTTVVLWMTSPLSGLPTTVVSFVPICVLTATGILTADDMRRLPWDILLLIAGGLSLGVAVDRTGLADWVVGRLPTGGVSPWLLVLGFGYLTMALSNLISNTATANIVLPLATAALASTDARLAAPIALCASLAMCLPISTPPNAIVYSTRVLGSRDLLAGGLLLGLLGPVVVMAWCRLALAWV
ncbi:MAG: DASS family sodium-coupled anion symporter [Planctomycetota bacterium]